MTEVPADVPSRGLAAPSIRRNGGSPIGALGAIAAVVGATGVDALKSLGVLMIAFYLTCIIFLFCVLGTILRVVAGVNILRLLRYLGRELLLILSTSSSETALPPSFTGH